MEVLTSRPFCFEALKIKERNLSWRRWASSHRGDSEEASQEMSWREQRTPVLSWSNLTGKHDPCCVSVGLSLPPVIEEVGHESEGRLAQGEGEVDEVGDEVLVGDPGEAGKSLLGADDLDGETEA